MRSNDTTPYPDNVPGRYYIDRTCIDCGLCPNLAPHTFAESEDGTHSYAYAQPQSEEEIADCEEAVATCPTCSVRNDGAELAKSA